MKVRIKIIVAVLLLMPILKNNNFIWAQQAKLNNEVVQSDNAYFKGLKLSELQQIKIASIIRSYKSQKIEIEKNASKKIRRKKLKNLKEQTKKDIDSVLNEEQKLKLENQKKRRIRNLLKYHV